jgi:L-iditol 2-dehydrogenase
MRAIVLQRPRELFVSEAPMPQPAEDEALVRVRATGICSTDLMVFQGRYSNRLPIVPGHEAAGVVERIGAQVSHLQVGDRVVVEASWGCGACAMCLSGEDFFCANRVSQGRTRNGTFAEYLTAPARAIHALPPEIEFNDAQAIITVACSVRAIRRGRPDMGDRVAIFGPGIAGIILAQLARINGASEVVVFGTRDWRLEAAHNHGASELVNVRQDHWALRALALTDGQGFDVIFEASGNPEALFDAHRVVRTGGRIVTFSLYDGPIDQFPAQMLYSKEITLIGVRGGAGGYPHAIESVRSGAVQLGSLVSHILPLSDADEGFALMERKEKGVMRVVLTP